MKFIYVLNIFVLTLSCTRSIDSNSCHSLNNNLNTRYQRIKERIANDSLSETGLFKALNILRIQNAKNCNLDSISLDIKIPFINIDTTFNNVLDLLVFEDSLLFLIEDLYLENQMIFNTTKPFFIKHFENKDETYYKVYNISFDSNQLSLITLEGDINLDYNYMIGNNSYHGIVEIRAGLVDSSLLRGEYRMNTNGKTFNYRLEDIKVLN